MDPANPLTRAPLNPHGPVADPAGAPGEAELERRLQELWNEWLRVYFRGEEFTTRDAAGAEVSRTFTECELVWGQGSYPQQEERPVIHGALVDLQAERSDRRAGYHGFTLRCTWNFFVRVASQIPPRPTVDASAYRARADHYCRRVAGELHWLLLSSEREGLSDRGVSRLRVLRGPIQVQSGSPALRQLVVAHEGFHEVPHHRAV